jgi:hypothetical protein
LEEINSGLIQLSHDVVVFKQAGEKKPNYSGAIREAGNWRFCLMTLARIPSQKISGPKIFHASFPFLSNFSSQYGMSIWQNLIEQCTRPPGEPG